VRITGTTGSSCDDHKADPEKEVEITDTRHIPKSDIPNVVIELEAEMRRRLTPSTSSGYSAEETIKKLEKDLREKEMKVALRADPEGP
jgi:excinuclease ABC subunit B